MKNLDLFLAILAAPLGLISGASAADSPAPSPAPPCLASVFDYLRASAEECPLTWQGVTIYGSIDVGGGYETHGVRLNPVFPDGVEAAIAKNSNHPLYTLVPNGLGLSTAGVKGTEAIANDWALVFRAETGFDPYSMQLANGPKSLVQNNTTPLDAQNANGDSSRAGQIFNNVAYAGFSHPIFGTLTAGRQDSLLLDVQKAYDPMASAPAFSLIGDSHTFSGVGDTESARYNSSVRYQLDLGPFRLASLHQFGGYAQGNGSNGAYEAQVGGDFGSFSFDATGSKVVDAVSLSNYASATLPAGVSSDNLKASLSNNTSGTIVLRYTLDALKFYGGFEYILFQNPTDAYPNGFTSLGGYTVLPGAVTSTDYTINKIMRVFWAGARYAVRDDLEVAGAFYHYYQNDYYTGQCTDGGLSNSHCKGHEDVVSGMVQYRPVNRITTYAGVMWSQVAGGLASGYLYHQNVAPTVGMRVQF